MSGEDTCPDGIVSGEQGVRRTTTSGNLRVRKASGEYLSGDCVRRAGCPENTHVRKTQNFTDSTIAELILESGSVSLLNKGVLREIRVFDLACKHKIGKDELTLLL